MSKNNNEAKLISLRTTGKGYGFGFLLFAFIALAILSTGYWEGEVPPFGEMPLNPYVSVIIVFGMFLIIYYNANKKFDVMGQSIDKGMIIYVSMVLLLLFVFG